MHISWGALFNSSHPWTKWPYFADDIFKYIFVDQRFFILIKIIRNFVPRGLIDNKPIRREAITGINADPIH